MSIEDKYRVWLEKAVADPDLVPELRAMTSGQIEDAFFRDLEFGTGGLRGIIGAGTNRMNIYTVAKASKGLSDYLNGRYEDPTVVIGFDTRIKSGLFADIAARVFTANGIKVNIWSEPLPVPTVSFAVRHLKASAGIMITASHNPSKYNGYKVYGDDGCQITNKAAEEILQSIEKTGIFEAFEEAQFGKSKAEKAVISSDVLDAFITAVKEQSQLYGDEVSKDVDIVYSPLNGTGLVPVTRALKDSGFNNITVVEEQKNPDGNFPTCPYPNPEIREAMELGLQYCRNTGADILIATDPDCDRCGIAVRSGEDYRLLTGNEVGLLLLDYICSQRQKHNSMPEEPVFIKTIVTMDLAEKIADSYGVRTVNVLTGFKYIGEQIGILEKQGREESYICGFEESYGYLTGTYVRDKDGVNAAFLISEMFAYYKTRGISLADKLDEIYAKFGYMRNSLKTFEFTGSRGFSEMQEIMGKFRNWDPESGDFSIFRSLGVPEPLLSGRPEMSDYSKGLGTLPKSNVLKFVFENGSVVIRPSGTEPKLKLYISEIEGE